MLNGKHRQPGPVPGPLCGSYAHVLPVLDDLTDARLAADTRAHLADCAWCRAQRATYDRFDEALRLHFAPDAMPFLPINAMEISMSDIHDTVATAISTDEIDGAAEDEMSRLTVTPLPIAPRPPRRSWRLATGAASLAAVLVISLLAGLIFVSHGRPQSASNRHATSTPAIAPGSQVSLSAVGMSSETDGWAMGQVMSQNGGSSEDPGYVLHYTNGRWAQVRNTPLKAGINAIKMLSSTDGWAIGNNVYHYDGAAWHEIHVPVTTGFNAISAVSPSNIWIAGNSTPVIPSDGRAVILHYDGYGWFQQQTPSVSDSLAIYDISMVSATEGWAVGTASGVPDSQGNAALTGVILRYRNGSWQLAKTLPNYDLRTISMGAVADGWLGGYKVTIVHGGQPFPGGNPSDLFSLNEPKVLHFVGGQWVEVSVPQSSEQPAGYPEYGQIASIRMVSATQGWLFAFFETQTIAPNDSTYLAPSIFQLENGHWMQIPAPLIHGQRYATMSQVSVISSTELWGIGECIAPTGTPDGSGYDADVTPLVVHYKNGVWDIVQS